MIFSSSPTGQVPGVSPSRTHILRLPIQGHVILRLLDQPRTQVLGFRFSIKFAGFFGLADISETLLISNCF
jgi:hypothetical protein